MTFQEPVTSPVTNHSTHDQLAVAGLASGDAREAARGLAASLVARCDDCRRLHDDLRLLAAAIHDLPAAAVPEGRNFRLSRADAERLTRWGWFRRLVRPFGEARRSVIRPLAGGLMTLGLAVIVLSGPWALPFGSAGAAPISASLGPVRTMSAPGQASPEDNRVHASGGDTSGGAPGIVGGTPEANGGGAYGLSGATPGATPGSDVKEAPAPPSREFVQDQIPWPVIGLVLAAMGLSVVILRRIALRLR